jgi:hypothetical protein
MTLSLNTVSTASLGAQAARFVPGSDELYRYKGLGRAVGQVKKAGCCHPFQRGGLHFPEISTGLFTTDVTITDRH